MGNESTTERLHVESLAELDALVGRHITGEKPKTHWEDSHAHLHFDSLDEALESLREPYFQQFIPEEDRARTVLREVEQYRCYTLDLDLAWDVVACLGNARGPLRVWREADGWHATFGERATVCAESAPVAICLAGLRSRGVEVELPANGFDGFTSESRVSDSLLSQLQPGLLAD